LRTGDLYKEKELLALIAKSDEAAFAELFDHYRNRIYSSARKLSREISSVQNVFLKIWLNRADLTGVNNFSAYLFVITRNEVYLALNRIARSYKIHSLFSKEQPPSDNDNERRFMDREYQNLLQKAIERLPVQQKKVYQLMKVQGLKREEAASLLRVHPETVKSHLAQAVKSVRSYCLLHLHLLYGLVFCFSFLS